MKRRVELELWNTLALYMCRTKIEKENELKIQENKPTSSLIPVISETPTFLKTCLATLVRRSPTIFFGEEGGDPPKVI